MALWDKISSRGNVEDRRSFAPVAAGGLGLGGLALYVVFNLLTGGDITVTDVANQLERARVEENQTLGESDFAGEDKYEVFASKVLGSNNDMWLSVMNQTGKRYTPPKLVLFRQATESSCGTATSTVGPHYCPIDQTIYLDETFFDELKTRFGAKGGDVAEAYVISHEVGHHAQNILGILENTLNAPEAKQQELAIKTELQADCFAGLWAYSIKDLGVFEPGEIKEAMDAAASVGDDRIQEQVTGYINPESWTHGSSTERVNAFTKGYDSGNLESCSF